MLIECLDLGPMSRNYVSHSSIINIFFTLLFPSAGVWLANLMVALVREPQQVRMKGAFRSFSFT